MKIILRHARGFGKGLSKAILLILVSATVLALGGCATSGTTTSTFPDRSGAPPYPDDPEANGNPAKGWYN